MEGSVVNATIALPRGEFQDVHIVCHKRSKVSSHGLFLGETPTTFTLPLLLVQICMVSISTKVTHYLFKPLGFPKIVGNIFGGIIMGPSLLGRCKMFTTTFFPVGSMTLLETAGRLGLAFFTFLVGVKMDPGIIRQCGKKAVFLGLSSLLLPLALLAALCLAIAAHLPSPVRLLPVVSNMVCSPFPVVAIALAELKLLNSDLGRLAQSASMASDIVFLGAYSIHITMTWSPMQRLTSWLNIVTLVMMGIVIPLVFRPVSLWIIKSTPEKQPVRETAIFIIILGVLLTTVTSEVIGPLILGMVIPNGPPLGSALEEKFELLVFEVLLPLYFASLGLRADFAVLFDDLKVFNAMVLVAVVGYLIKIAATMLPTILFRMPLQDAFVFSLFMSTQGIIHVVMLNIWGQFKMVSDQEYIILLMAILVTGIIFSSLAAAIYKPSMCYIAYKWRTIQHTIEHNSEFRVLACVHGEDDVPTLINLLRMSHPNKWHPVAIHVLRLINLVGRASPLFVPYKPQKHATNPTSTDRIINAFRCFEQEHHGHVWLQPFTVIAPRVSMHMDVCSLALTSHASLVVMPFHKHPALSGKMMVVAEGHGIQTVNQKVMEKSPCSVGILIDRRVVGTHRVPKQRSFRVAALFLGGRDDREALAYATRMASNPDVTLNVVRCVLSPINSSSKLDDDDIEEERGLDDKMVDLFLQNVQGNERVIYQEETVKSGVETIGVIRSMGDLYDLFMVGRGPVMMETELTSGLKEWNESSELGIIGDYLASSDYSGAAAVLVVQQQARVGCAYTVSSKTQAS